MRIRPGGYRQGHAAVRHAELYLARDRAILAEQEKEIVSDLAGAIVEMDRAYELAKTNYNRRMAAVYQLETLEQLLKEPDAAEKPRLLDLQLDAQRRLADAESHYYQALCEHAVAIKNVYFQRGALLEYNRVYLTEGDWPGKAYRNAARRERLRRPSPILDRLTRQGPILSAGPYAQEQNADSPPEEASKIRLPVIEPPDEAPNPAN